MLHKTKGIVLNYIKYRDTSVIVRVYTQSFGVQSYIINSIRSRASKKSLALLQPLTLLDLVVYFNKSKAGGINRLSEYRSALPFKSIPFDIRKSTIALFISEWLSKILNEEENDNNHPGQFDFIFHSIEQLDHLQTSFENFHLQMMIKLSPFIGFGEITTSSLLLHTSSIEVEKQTAEQALILGSRSYEQPFETNHLERNKILDVLIDYYQQHIDGMGEIKSAAVLRDVFRV